MPNQQLPFILAGPVTQQDIDDAGIPANVIVGPSGFIIQMRPGYTPDDVSAAQALVDNALGQPSAPTVNVKRAELTDAWLMVKACLEALPPVPEQGADPYADSRIRLEAKVQMALDAMNNEGGPG